MQYPTDQFKEPPEGVLVNNRFILKNKVGRGSFGCVFRGKTQKLLINITEVITFHFWVYIARDKNTNTDVALKMVGYLKTHFIIYIFGLNIHPYNFEALIKRNVLIPIKSL